jgi:hypothetical protein
VLVPVESAHLGGGRWLAPLFFLDSADSRQLTVGRRALLTR